MYKRFSLVIMFILAAFQAPGLAQNNNGNNTVGQILDAARNYGDYKKDERRRERADERRHERRELRRHDRHRPHRDNHRHPSDRRR